MARHNTAREQDIHGWCGTLGEEWFLPDGLRRPCLTGHVDFETSLDLKEGEKVIRIHSADLRVYPSEQAPAESDNQEMHGDGELSPYLAGQHYEGTLSIEGTSFPGLPETQLSLELPIDEFEKLSARASNPIAVVIAGRLPEPTEWASTLTQEGFVAFAVSEIRLKVTSINGAPPSWVTNRRAVELIEALSRIHLKRSRNSQVLDIIREIAESAARTALSQKEREDTVEAAIDLFSGIRSAFRLPVSMNGEGRDNIWNLNPDEFEAYLEGRPEDEAGNLRRSYDLLWEHFSVMQVLQVGESKAGAIRRGFFPSVEDLEDLAFRYLKNPKVNSPTLEWALIDALIYAECIAFAQTIFSTKKILGIPVQEKLQGLTTFKAARQKLVKSVGIVVLELMLVSLTYYVASLLANGDTQATWTITTGVTAVRWILQSIQNRSKGTRDHGIELLSQMANLHHLLKRRWFDAPSLRDGLYRVAAEGAGFSPWVYRLLEARIRRERSSC